MNRLAYTCTTALLVLSLVGAPTSVDAQDSTPATDPSVDAYVEGLIRALESPRTPEHKLTLAEAIASAVLNNPGILADARSTEQAIVGVLEAGAAYDPTIRIESGYGESTRLTANRVETGINVFDLQEIEEDRYTADVGLSKLFKYGTEVELEWTNRRSTTNAAFQILSPSYDPTLGVNITQPLLDNVAGLRQRTTVLLARNTSRHTAADFETVLADFVAGIVDAYWGYTEAEAELEVRHHALKLARELVEETSRRVEVGTLPPVAAQEASADAAAREEEVIRAENDLDLAARTLQYRVMFGGDEGRAPIPVRPAEGHVVRDMPLARDRILRNAVQQRPEVRASRLALSAAALRERQARNELLPNLDIVGNYTLLGLGGEPVEADDVNSYAEALDRLTGGDFYRFSVGLRLEVPLSNAEARARHAREVIEIRRAQDELRRVVSEVALEVERAVGDVASARKRVDAARVARELAEKNLANQKRRYEVGIVTTTDVLEFQDSLTSAMAAEVLAVSDHARAVARLRRAEGTLLQSYGVQVGFEDAPELPWWGKF